MPWWTHTAMSIERNTNEKIHINILDDANIKDAKVKFRNILNELEKHRLTNDLEAAKLSYFEGLTEQKTRLAPIIRLFIESGHIDSLHSWGNFDKGGFKRYHAEKGMEILNKYNFDIAQQNFAWIADNKIEKKMIRTMKKGSRIMISGYNSSGSQTIDHYSLLGFTKAYNEAKKSCS